METKEYFEKVMQDFNQHRNGRSLRKYCQDEGIDYKYSCVPLVASELKGSNIKSFIADRAPPLCGQAPKLTPGARPRN